MAFDTFDEGINPGGMRSKNEKIGRASCRERV